MYDVSLNLPAAAHIYSADFPTELVYNVHCIMYSTYIEKLLFCYSICTYILCTKALLFTVYSVYSVYVCCHIFTNTNENYEKNRCVLSEVKIRRFGVCMCVPVHCAALWLTKFLNSNLVIVSNWRICRCDGSIGSRYLMWQYVENGKCCAYRQFILFKLKGTLAQFGVKWQISKNFVLVHLGRQQ